MSKSVSRTRRRRAGALPSHTPSPGGADRSGDKLARREAPGGRELLDRILNTPRLERVVPRLQPGLLHRVIQLCGLEDCGELVALATPEQLARIFDLDLWRAAKPGLDEQFDADRFGLWLEVLLESGPAAAAQKLAGMDLDLVVAGLAQHVLVYDRAAVTPDETMDGEQMDAIRAIDDGLTSDVGGCVLVARRADSWEAIVEVLISLDAEHSGYFHQVMRGCRMLSDSKPEVDGLHDLLPEREQVIFDLAVEREGRREQQGYVLPPQARAFLHMSRQLRLTSDAMPAANPLARAYFRAIDEGMGADLHSASGLLAAGSEASPAAEETAEAVEAVCSVLREAGVLAPAPRALLGGAEGHAPRLGRIQAHLQWVLDHDPAAYATRSEELAYLANTLMAGCSIQGQPLTAQEASDAAVAVCNLGLENWPSHWLPAKATAPPGSLLVDHDLVSVFQVGWAVLHHEVSLYAAEQLIGVLTRMRCDDREMNAGLEALRSSLKKHWQAGAPWRARDALDVMATLDMVAWAVLLALISECPVLHAGVSASRDCRTLSVSATDFEFISENSQIASVREFMQSLPERLGRSRARQHARHSIWQRNARGSLPFCHLTLRASKPLPSAHPCKLNTLGDWIRKCRLDLRLTQLQVAELIGVVECCVTNWELNRTEPEISYVPMIIKFIGYCPYIPTADLIERLKTVRWALGLSQRQLAQILGVDRSQITAWETGGHQPTKKSLKIIETFFAS